MLSEPLTRYTTSTTACTAMSGPSLAPYILKRPWLKRWMVPFANWYADKAGYRKLGTWSRYICKHTDLTSHRSPSRRSDTRRERHSAACPKETATQRSIRPRFQIKESIPGTLDWGRAWDTWLTLSVLSRPSTTSCERTDQARRSEQPPA